jgi:2-hydroxy-3-keto-5-methylthiopentenyl-1-phosphate phosphatase
MAMAASVVFARDRLAKYLDDRQKSYIPWHDFFDVLNYLSERWQ